MNTCIRKYKKSYSDCIKLYTNEYIFIQSECINCLEFLETKKAKTC